MIDVQIEAIGLAAPGLPTWAESRGVLRGEQPYVASELPAYAPPLLPPNERRRATLTVRQAFRAAEEAVQGRDAGTLATVFAGSDAEMPVLHRICAGLAAPGRIISPTDFHNSVHNAAAGYWGIATGSRAPSTTLAGYDGSFALGLLEAALQVVTQRTPVLLVVFDNPAPQPLAQARTHAVPASCALWLAPADAGTPSLARLRLAPRRADETTIDDAVLEALRTGNPALRSLPLLRAIACGGAHDIVLPNVGGRPLAVRVTA